MAKAEQRDDLTDLIADLVRIETENPPGNEAACAEYIRDWFTERDIEVTFVREPYTDRPQVVASIGESDPTLVLNGHIDVVPAGNRSEWNHDPYDAEIENGTLYGRGSADMKTGVAVGMVAAADLKPELENNELDGSIMVHAAIGEETAEPGTKTLLEEGYDGEYGVVLEPTGLHTATSEKGLAWYEITVTGEPSHASRPDQGVNAVQQARPVLDALTEYDTRIREREDELVGQAYATVTQFTAGTKENVVPEEAIITIDRRFLPGESVTEIDAEIKSLLAEIEREHDIKTDWERTRTYESASIDSDSYLAEIFRAHSNAVAGVTSDPWGIQASTDVRNFINNAEIEAITWGAGDLSQAHTYNEHIDLSAAATGLNVLKQAARDLLSE